MGHKFTPYNEYNKQKSFLHLSTEQKVFIGGGIATLVIIVGGIFFVANTGPSTKPLMGQEVKIGESSHVPAGTKVSYTSDPPAGGHHYDDPVHAGFYDKPQPDGNLVHSLEHGAVIIWYNPNKLSKDQIESLKKIFNQLGGKSITVPRDSIDTPLALSSWGRALRLSAIDEKQIKAFFETNRDRGPEQAPI